LAEDGTVSKMIGDDEENFELDMFGFLIEAFKFFKSRTEVESIEE